MRKILLTIVSATMVFTLFSFNVNTINANYNVASTRDTDAEIVGTFEGKENKPSLEVGYFQNGQILTRNASEQRSIGTLGAIIGVISGLITIGGFLVDCYIWLHENQVPSSAIASSVMDNYNTTEYKVVSQNVVYDTGCWKPEFPNNPFCRSKQAVMRN